MPMTPKEFVERWSQSTLREQQGAQSHFNELCELVGHKTPTQADPEGKFFTFEEQVTKATGGKGRADVWKQGHFAWEYKGKHKDLDAAYAQLSAYRGDLGNPPLLVVCDFLEYRIYPQWPNTSGQPFKFTNQDLLDREAQNYIRWLLESPEKFLELRQTELQKREQLTKHLAEKFAHLADLMREQRNDDGQFTWQSMQIARFLTKLVFCLFAEDVDLLPRPFNETIFRYITESAIDGLPEMFVETMQMLFSAMDGRVPGFIMKPVPYFNGGLFADSAPGRDDGLEALDLTLIATGINLLKEVSEADWRKVDPSIFGTLFEGALDPRKRTQLGAHFTSESDIRLIVEPVLMLPLYREWDTVRDQAEPLMQTYLKKETPRSEQEARTKLIQLHDQMMNRLEKIRVLDPACGSGNFLYVSLRLMKDLEGKVRKFFEPLALPFRDVVTPRQLYGIEKDEFAAKLAHVVAWIGYLQWRYEDEGILHYKLPRRTEHPRQLPHPIIQDKNSPDEPDRIICADSIMRYDAEGNPYEPEWPEVDVIVGNPPFLGGNRIRSELGDTVDKLFKLYDGRVPAFADLVCYWFEKAQAHIKMGKAKRAGLLATNSIRGGVNREVLKHIKENGDIFMAWADRDWVLEGAAVRVSMVGFDGGQETVKTLDGEIASTINTDLTGSVDITQAKQLTENLNLQFEGTKKGASFDITSEIASQMLQATNTSGRSNSDVVRSWTNGSDIVRRPSGTWIIDFGTNMPIEEAKLYELPFKHAEKYVKSKYEASRSRWWLHERTRPEMREALAPLSRFIGTPRVAKHRIFVWQLSSTLPDSATIAIAREDDYFFGVLHSKLHEIWSLLMGTSLEDRPRYTPTTTFETFPFPWSPGKEDTSSPAYQAISAAAKRLHEERDEWLNPPELMGENAGLGAADLLKKRTLTNLYNALEDYRKRGNGEKSVNGPRKAPTAADTFAPRLHELHTALDRAVCDAYGWPHNVLNDEEEMLRRLLALNLERAGN
jgi:hypothetical protein